MLDQDSFKLLRQIGIRDDVAPIQIGAGCAGMARAVQIAARLNVENTLIITYNLPSVLGVHNGGELPPQYKSNEVHPFAGILWLSAAIFSDAVAAVVLSRNGAPTNGFVFYSRDSQAFGPGPAFTDPIVHFPGGGINHPVGTKNGAALSAYGMSGEAIKTYYKEGMLINHSLVTAHRPNYINEVARIYTHQASPALVDNFVELANLPHDKVPTHARKLGNLVTPCTMKLSHDDLVLGVVKFRDEVCVLVVGAGPERGGFLLPVEIKHYDKL
jgi:3-oxoacyl-[acyl-carrier-protein] synthase-3